MNSKNAKYFWTIIITLVAGILAGIWWTENREVLINTVIAHFEAQKYWYYLVGILIFNILSIWLMLKILNKKHRKEILKLILWNAGSLMASIAFSLIFLIVRIEDKTLWTELVFIITLGVSGIHLIGTLAITLDKKFKKKEVEA